MVDPKMAAMLAARRGADRSQMPSVRTRPQMPASNPSAPMIPTPMPGAVPGAMKKGGAVKKMASGGSASKRADGIAQRGKTKGTMIMCGGGMAKKG